MGLYDRDYMKDQNAAKGNRKNQDASPTFVITAAVAVRFLLCIIAIIVFFRLPIIWWVKFPAIVGICIAGWKWILKTQRAPGKQASQENSPTSTDHFKEGRAAEAAKDFERAVRHYEIAAGKPLKPNHESVRLLAAYDAAGKLGLAKSLLQELDGRKFPDSAADELESLAEKYFPVQIKKTPGGAQLLLV